jgi:hypothetical protein
MSHDERAAFITGLRGLADFLAAHPAVPVPPGYHKITIHVFPGAVTPDVSAAGAR